MFNRNGIRLNFNPVQSTNTRQSLNLKESGSCRHPTADSTRAKARISPETESTCSEYSGKGQFRSAASHEGQYSGNLVTDTPGRVTAGILFPNVS
jgi:hypothetical protein